MGECLHANYFKITACLSNYLELRHCRPKTERLKALLGEWPFRGSEYEMEGAWEESQGWGAGESVPVELREDSIGTKPKKRKKRAPKKVSASTAILIRIAAMH